MSSNLNSHKKIMAFDFGTKHIGIAIGQTITQSAEGLCQIKADNGLPDWVALDAIVLEWKPDLFVIGLPLNMDGSPSHMSQRANKFANRLKDRYQVECQLMDERLSSREVKNERHNHDNGKKTTIKNNIKLHKKKKPKEIDSLAAAVILQSWLNEKDT